MDCYWSAKGSIIWDINAKVNSINGYQMYAEEAVKLVLIAGHSWGKLQDSPHIQYQLYVNSAIIYPIAEIDQRLYSFFK